MLLKSWRESLVEGYCGLSEGRHSKRRIQVLFGHIQFEMNEELATGNSYCHFLNVNKIYIQNSRQMGNIQLDEFS